MIVERAEVVAAESHVHVEELRPPNAGRKVGPGDPRAQRRHHSGRRTLAGDVEHDEAYPLEVDRAGVEQRVQEGVGLLLGRRFRPARRARVQAIADPLPDPQQ